MGKFTSYKTGREKIFKEAESKISKFESDIGDYERQIALVEAQNAAIAKQRRDIEIARKFAIEGKSTEGLTKAQKKMVREGVTEPMALQNLRLQQAGISQNITEIRDIKDADKFKAVFAGLTAEQLKSLEKVNILKLKEETKQEQVAERFIDYTPDERVSGVKLYLQEGKGLNITDTRKITPPPNTIQVPDVPRRETIMYGGSSDLWAIRMKEHTEWTALQISAKEKSSTASSIGKAAVGAVQEPFKILGGFLGRIPAPAAVTGFNLGLDYLAGKKTERKPKGTGNIMVDFFTPGGLLKYTTSSTVGKESVAFGGTQERLGEGFLYSAETGANILGAKKEFTVKQPQIDVYQKSTSVGGRGQPSFTFTGGPGRKTTYGKEILGFTDPLSRVVSFGLLKDTKSTVKSVPTLSLFAAAPVTMIATSQIAIEEQRRTAKQDALDMANKEYSDYTITVPKFEQISKEEFMNIRTKEIESSIQSGLTKGTLLNIGFLGAGLFKFGGKKVYENIPRRKYGPALFKKRATQKELVQEVRNIEGAQEMIAREKYLSSQNLKDTNIFIGGLEKGRIEFVSKTGVDITEGRPALLGGGGTKVGRTQEGTFGTTGEFVFGKKVENLYTGEIKQAITPTITKIESVSIGKTPFELSTPKYLDLKGGSLGDVPKIFERTPLKYSPDLGGPKIIKKGTLKFLRDTKEVPGVGKRDIIFSTIDGKSARTTTGYTEGKYTLYETSKPTRKVIKVSEKTQPAVTIQPPGSKILQREIIKSDVISSAKVNDLFVRVFKTEYRKLPPPKKTLRGEEIKNLLTKTPSKEELKSSFERGAQKSTGTIGVDLTFPRGDYTRINVVGKASSPPIQTQVGIKSKLKDFGQLTQNIEVPRTQKIGDIIPLELGGGTQPSQKLIMELTDKGYIIKKDVSAAPQQQLTLQQLQKLPPAKTTPTTLVSPPRLVSKPAPTTTSSLVGVPRMVGGEGLTEIQLTSRAGGVVPLYEEDFQSTILPPITRDKIIGKTFVTTDTGLKVDTAVDTGTILKPKVSTKTDVLSNTQLKTDVIPKTKQGTITLLKPALRQGTEIKVATKQIPVVKTKVSTKEKIVPSLKPRRITVPVPLPSGVDATPTVKALKKLKGKGVDVKVGMILGKQKTIAKNLPPYKALKKGMKYVDKNIEASFKLVPSGKKTNQRDIKPMNINKKFRSSKVNPLFVVEKRKFRLDSPTEKRQLKKSKIKKSRLLR